MADVNEYRYRAALELIGQQQLELKDAKDRADLYWKQLQEREQEKPGQSD